MTKHLCYLVTIVYLQVYLHLPLILVGNDVVINQLWWVKLM